MRFFSICLVTASAALTLPGTSMAQVASPVRIEASYGDQGTFPLSSTGCGFLAIAERAEGACFGSRTLAGVTTNMNVFSLGAGTVAGELGAMTMGNINASGGTGGSATTIRSNVTVSDIFELTIASLGTHNLSGSRFFFEFLLSGSTYSATSGLIARTMTLGSFAVGLKSGSISGGGGVHESCVAENQTRLCSSEYQAAELQLFGNTTKVTVTRKLEARQSVYLQAGDAGGSVAATADFSQTASIAGYRLVDNTGTDISHQVAVTDNYGNTYMSVTATPEPISLALIATGFAGVAGAARRRRRR